MTQNEKVLRHLRMYGTITDNEARDRYGIHRLAARICELRNKYGYVITSERIVVPTREGKKAKVAKYYLSPTLRTEAKQ